jgi:hypothetical protein
VTRDEQVSMRLESALLADADDVRDQLAALRLTRSQVLRMAIEAGLPVLRRQYRLKARAKR